MVARLKKRPDPEDPDVADMLFGKTSTGDVAAAMSSAEGAPPPPEWLATKYRDIRRLTSKLPVFAAGVAKGNDPEDMISAVVVGLITRQHGRSKFDPARSSWVNYVCLVGKCVLMNLLDKQRRFELNETTGIVDRQREETTEVDAAKWAEAHLGAWDSRHEGLVLGEAIDLLHPDDRAAARALARGDGSHAAAMRTGTPLKCVHAIANELAEILRDG